MYKERVAAQVAAYFLWKAREPIELIKVIKLMYFAEREYLLSREARLTGDDLFSMRYGPVLSNTLDIFHVLPHNQYWSRWLGCESNNKIVLKKQNCTRESFDLLNNVTLKILDKVFNKYGKYEAFTLVNLTHKPEHCPEWQFPGNSRIQIRIEDILRNHGHSKKDVSEIIGLLKEQDDYDNLIADLTT